MSCPFANLFGAPRTGIHSIRIFDIAIIDVLFTCILAYFTKGNHKYFLVLLFWFIIGIILHKLFCVDTKIDSILFGKK